LLSIESPAGKRSRALSCHDHMSTGRLLICLELGTCAVDEAEMIAASTDAAVEIATRAP
jgi:hypothetical protein